MKKTILAKNIKKLRLFKSMNQTEFAELFDLKRSSIGAYEEGRAEPKLDALIKISNYFDLAIDDIVKGELTVNKIAGFELPAVDTTDISNLNDKIDSIYRRIDLMDKKLTQLNKDKNK
ncbi:MAG: transcriptional regulator with XRE-family HTH domain [Crocinitomix sp.]|jgi:transcriptional regulator with XRE-family HTH domain